MGCGPSKAAIATKEPARRCCTEDATLELAKTLLQEFEAPTKTPDSPAADSTKLPDVGQMDPIASTTVEPEEAAAVVAKGHRTEQIHLAAPPLITIEHRDNGAGVGLSVSRETAPSEGPQQGDLEVTTRSLWNSRTEHESLQANASRDNSVDEGALAKRRGENFLRGVCACCDVCSPCVGSSQGSEKLEDLVQELFRLHDLNGDGVLEETELIRLNETIALLHQGADADAGAVEVKYRNFFRTKFDKDGKPVPYSTFRGYMFQLLTELDRHQEAQEMIMEQFIAEARMARTMVYSKDPQQNTETQGFKVSSCYAFCINQEKSLEVVRVES